MRSLDSLTQLQEVGKQLSKDNYCLETTEYMNNIIRLYGSRKAMEKALDEFHGDHKNHHSGADCIHSLSRFVGEPLDKEAIGLIAKYVRQTSGWTIVNPLALLDHLIIIWLTLKMIRGVAEIYGGRPGIVASWKLAREATLLIAAVGATDLLADTAADVLSVGLAGRVSTKMAQGLMTGLFTVRIGLYTLKICRPIPLEDDNNQLWKNLRREVFAIFSSGN